MKELIFDIFTALAANALNDSCDVVLRYENSKRHSKTIISESNADIDELTMQLWPAGAPGSSSESADDEEDEEQD